MLFRSRCRFLNSTCDADGLTVPRRRQNLADSVASVDTDDDCSGLSRGWACSSLDAWPPARHHGANWTPRAEKIEGTVVGELPIRKDLRLLTEEGYSVKFYLRDTFGSVVILDPILDSSGNPVR